MTFAIVDTQAYKPHVIGILWGADEEAARAMAPVLLEEKAGHTTIQRVETREIPLKIQGLNT